MRHGRKNLDEEIKAIFGEETGNRDTSEEPSITYSEYVNKITHRALKKQELMLKKKMGKMREGEDESELHWPLSKCAWGVFFMKNVENLFCFFPYFKHYFCFFFHLIYKLAVKNMTFLNF